MKTNLISKALTISLLCATSGFMSAHVHAEQSAAATELAKLEESPLKSSQLPAGDSPQTIEAAAKMGAETAATDIKAGVNRILYYGEPFPTGKPLVDVATGYRMQIVAGCIVSRCFVAEADAYNQAMRNWHAKNPIRNSTPKANAPATQAVPKDAPPFKTGIRNVEPPIGSLGYKIGTYLTIEGVRDDRAKGGASTLLVDTIKGHKLEQPVPIRIYGVVLPENERCIFKGYETGQWIGVPEEVLRATGRTPPQAGWQFHFGFSPTSVEQPKGLKLE